MVRHDPNVACYLPSVINPHTEITVGDGPYTIVLWCGGRPIILVGLERYPVQGERFEIEGAVWVVTDDTESYIAARLAS